MSRPDADLYEKDLYAWARENANLLRNGNLSEIDVEHIAEELEDMGKSERRALASHVQNLLLHLLKWRYQSERRSTSWEMSIANSRDAIQDILADSPSLKPSIEYFIAQMYPRARKAARIETGFQEAVFPEDCPFYTKQILDENFWPEA